MPTDSTRISEPSNPVDRFCRLGVETLLLCLVALAPWAFGGVEPWAQALLQGVAGVVLLLWSFRSVFGSSSPSISHRAPVVLAVLFLGLFLIQLLPLPSGVVGILSPGGTETRTALLPVSAEGDSEELTVTTLTVGWERSLRSLFAYCAYAILFLAALAHLKSEASIQRLLLVIVGTGGCLSLFGIAQKLAGNGKIYWMVELTRGGNPFGPYVNRNHFAGYVEMAALAALGIMAFRIRKWSRDRGGIPFNVSSFLSDRDGAHVVILGLTAMAMITSVFFSLSRGGMVALTAGCVVLCLGMLERRGLLLGMGALFAGTVGLVIWLGGNELFRRMAALDELHFRFDLWKSCVSMILAFPIFGVGAGNFSQVIPAFQEFPAHRTFHYAESDWWHFGSEFGLVGLLLIAGAAILLTRVVVKGLRGSSRIRPLLGGLVAALLAIALHGFVDFNLHIPANAVLALLLIASTWNLSTRSLRARTEATATPSPTA